MDTEDEGHDVERLLNTWAQEVTLTKAAKSSGGGWVLTLHTYHDADHTVIGRGQTLREATIDAFASAGLLERPRKISLPAWVMGIGSFSAALLVSGLGCVEGILSGDMLQASVGGIAAGLMMVMVAATTWGRP